MNELTLKYAQMRRLVWAAMVLNAVVALGVAITVVAIRPTLSARFEPGFPSDMLLVKNGTGARLEEVVLELDQRWVARVRRLEPGVRGFELKHAFEDVSEARPPNGYVPRSLTVSHSEGSATIEVSIRRTKP